MTRGGDGPEQSYSGLHQDVLCTKPVLFGLPCSMMNKVATHAVLTSLKRSSAASRPRTPFVLAAPYWQYSGCRSSASTVSAQYQHTAD
jgi:hypothetical protein